MFFDLQFTKTIKIRLAIMDYTWIATPEAQKDLQRIAVSPFVIKVPKVGLEPTRSCEHWILNPARLPVPPLRPFVANK